MKILITGATGFIGRILCSRLLSEGYRVRATMLTCESPSSVIDGAEPVVIEPIGPDTAWKNALRGIDTVIHLAARVHVMDDSAADPLLEFRRVNTAGTEHLANEAVKAGVKRLVYVSSIKVNGEESALPYTDDSPAHPADPYGISKWEAEQALRRIEKESGLKVVIVRPPLVYGPGVKANFLSLMKMVYREVPLPFSSINNKRSLVYVGNLADALATCATHPAAEGKTYLVSDFDDISTPELIRRISVAFGVPSKLFYLPVTLMLLAGKLAGKGAAVKRLTGSLALDSMKIRRELDWSPPFTMAEGLRATTDWYLKTHGGME